MFQPKLAQLDHTTDPSWSPSLHPLASQATHYRKLLNFLEPEP